MTTTSTEGQPETASAATVTPPATATAMPSAHENTPAKPVEKNDDEDSDFDELDGISNLTPAQASMWNDTLTSSRRS